jgi:hypothetical protein
MYTIVCGLAIRFLTVAADRCPRDGRHELEAGLLLAWLGSEVLKVLYV